VSEGSRYPRTAPLEGLQYLTIAISGEVGEFANEVKKALRDDGGELTPMRRDNLHAELGDVLWYLVAICRELGVSLEFIIKKNKAKLDQRRASVGGGNVC